MMRNGVDMERVNALTEAMRKDAAVGRRTLSGITSWNGGAHSTTIVRNFAIPADEPVLLGGTNRGASPTELVLTGLSACIAVGIAYSAAEDGIEVDSIEIDVEGDLDLGGFFEVRLSEGQELEKPSGFEPRRSGERLSVGQEFEKPAGFRGTEHEKTRSVFERRLSEGQELEHREPRPGLEEIRLTVRVDADAPREKIEELVHHGYRRSPVAASLEGRVPIRVCIGWEETRAA